MKQKGDQRNMSTKAEHAAELHQRGCNCAQAVACTFCKEFGISEDDMFRIAEGFGLGMKHIVFTDSRTKGDTYKKIRSKVEKFKEKNGSCICRELKGVETGKVLCSCPQCIADAVALTEEYLAEQGK